MKDTSPQYFLYYTDSLNQRHKIPYDINDYNSIMELIFDQCYEEWGDCKGRAWCGTCHMISPKGMVPDRLDHDERYRLGQLSNRVAESRLACQISLSTDIHGAEFVYIGGD